jgi:predicted Rossmann fold flavoprotein
VVSAAATAAVVAAVVAVVNVAATAAAETAAGTAAVETAAGAAATEGAASGRTSADTAGAAAEEADRERVRAQAPDPPVWPAAVVGAGAAGILAAIFAARGGVRVLLLESRPRPGAKIRVSGGGRCNLLPSAALADDFHTEGSPHAMRNVLASWPLEEVRGFFEGELGIALEVEPTGKVFPQSEDPREVVAALLGECERAGVRLVGGWKVRSARRAERADGARFQLEGPDGETVACRSLVLATGGLSLPKTGSDGSGFELARALGHEPLQTYPALVPLLSGDARWASLAGISLRARLRASRDGALIEEREGDLLFTHRGFSGPLVLDLSWRRSGPWGEGVELSAHWLGTSVREWDLFLRQGGPRSVAAALRDELPRRLAALLLERAQVDPARRLGELSREERRRLVTELEACRLDVAGDEGYRTAEVTGGGIPLGELSTRTLESRRVPGLYFCGEMVDVTGRIGGFNFLWAFVSGHKVGQALAARPPP